MIAQDRTDPGTDRSWEQRPVRDPGAEGGCTPCRTEGGPWAEPRVTNRCPGGELIEKGLLPKRQSQREPLAPEMGHTCCSNLARCS